MKKFITIISSLLLSATFSLATLIPYSTRQLAKPADVPAEISAATKSIVEKYQGNAVLYYKDLRSGELDITKYGVTHAQVQNFLLASVNKRDVNSAINEAALNVKNSWPVGCGTLVGTYLVEDKVGKVWFASLDAETKKNIAISISSWILLVDVGYITKENLTNWNWFGDVYPLSMCALNNSWTQQYTAKHTGIDLKELQYIYYTKCIIATGNFTDTAYQTWFIDYVSGLDAAKAKETLINELKVLSGKISADNTQAINWYNRLLLLKNIY